MNNTHRITMIVGLAALLGLTACVVDRGQGRAGQGSYQRAQGNSQQGPGRDRDGRACDDAVHAPDGHHDEDCRPRRP